MITIFMNFWALKKMADYFPTHTTGSKPKLYDFNNHLY